MHRDPAGPCVICDNSTVQLARPFVRQIDQQSLTPPENNKAAEGGWGHQRVCNHISPADLVFAWWCGVLCPVSWFRENPAEARARYRLPLRFRFLVNGTPAVANDAADYFLVAWLEGLPHSALPHLTLLGQFQSVFEKGS